MRHVLAYAVDLAGAKSSSDTCIQSKENMNIHLKALNAVGELIFEGYTAVDGTHLIAMSESRVAMAREKGRTFTEGAVPFFATELLKAAQQGASTNVLEGQSFNVAMAAWLACSLFGDVSEDDFVNSNLHFTLLANGAVKYDRIKKQHADFEGLL